MEVGGVLNGKCHWISLYEWLVASGDLINIEKQSFHVL